MPEISRPAFGSSLRAPWMLLLVLLPATGLAEDSTEGMGPSYGCFETNKTARIYWSAGLGGETDQPYSGPWDSHTCPVHTQGPDTFKKDGCVAPGYRQFSSRLWGVEPGGSIILLSSWTPEKLDAACKGTPITIGGLVYPTPTRCKTVGISEEWGEWDVRDSTCGEAGPVSSWGVFTAGSCDSSGARSYSAQLNPSEVHPDDEALLNACRNFSQTPVPSNRLWSHAVPSSCALVGGVAVGTWVLPGSPSCGKGEAYERPPGEVDWNDAVTYCFSKGKHLCRKDDICSFGAPNGGQPEGDVWMAVVDDKNAWISIGTANPERLCRFHHEEFGYPSWGLTTGPLPVTGQATALRCCG